ncbi:MAG TPA: bifunctional glutamate N-acetyltransferase/amino-acid acetyltransferase ArgJ [Propionibacteriaceae bacterium]|nr:bifunctional glutamate N-acetyltransferase/amino-acid acetyltransferase ArgJ [Propionibacteriaceae bacterium]
MSVTTAAGFMASAVTAGLKPSGKRDLALVVNTGPLFDAAAVFTTNRVKAAPVLWSEEVIKDGRLRAVILNSGGANACTGAAGFADTHQTAELVADALRQADATPAQGSLTDVGPIDWTDVGAIDVAVCSTGLIGLRLPMDKITSGIGDLVPQLTGDGGQAAAEAIMTTDTVPKQASYADEGWSVGGMAKGAGMLAPGLATMLVIITTDALVDSERLPGHLAEACRKSFERIDSDGCMSTNDTVVLMSSGASGVQPAAKDFQEALDETCADLATQLIADAEGASHDIAITVEHATSEDDAVEVGRTIARSNLLKCAIFGQDPNWGRVLAAIGTTAADFEPDRIDVSFNGVEVCRDGGIGEPRELVDLSGRKVDIVVNLRNGRHGANIWTNDLTYDYVRENAEYST